MVFFGLRNCWHLGLCGSLGTPGVMNVAKALVSLTFCPLHSCTPYCVVVPSFFNHFVISSAVFLVAECKAGEVETLGRGGFQEYFFMRCGNILLPRK